MNREIKEIRKKNKDLADEELKRIVNDCRIKYHKEHYITYYKKKQL